jgi:hypothetical protein
VRHHRQLASASNSYDSSCNALKVYCAVQRLLQLCCSTQVAQAAATSQHVCLLRAYSVSNFHQRRLANGTRLIAVALRRYYGSRNTQTVTQMTVTKMTVTVALSLELSLAYFIKEDHVFSALPYS